MTNIALPARRAVAPRAGRGSLDRPGATAVISLAGWTGFAVARLVTWAHGDISRFIMSGVKKYSHPREMWPPIGHVPLSGYDGQFYYRLALDPFNWRHAAYGITMDHAYRYTRLGYPLLAWALSLGQARLLPLVLVAINLACVAAIGWLGGILARDAGRHALWGLLLVAYFGTVISVGRDTAEPLAGALMLGGLLALRRGRPGLAAALLACAVVTDETMLVLPVAIFLGGYTPIPPDPPARAASRRIFKLRRTGPLTLRFRGPAGLLERSKLRSLALARLAAPPAVVGTSRRRLAGARFASRATRRRKRLPPHPGARLAAPPAVVGASHRRLSRLDLAWIMPTAAWLVLQVIERLVVRGGAGASADLSRNLGLPFQGMERGLRADVRLMSWSRLGTHDINLIEFAALAIVVLAGFLVLRSTCAPVVERMAFAGFVLVEMVLATWQFWGSTFGDGRAYVDCYLLAIVVLLATPQSGARPAVTSKGLATVAAIAVTALVVVARRRILFE
jgi:hypothetical protein